jgi:hypothetical protein
MLRYQKHAEQSDRDIALIDYKYTSKPQARGSAQAPGSMDKAVWRVGRAKGSDGSILPRHNFDNAPNAIMATSNVRIT